MKNAQTSIPQMVMLAPMARWCQGPRPFERQPEKVDSSSKTIPDDSFSIADLFSRFQKGQPLPLGLDRPVRFADDPTHQDLDLERISRMDLAEINDIKKRVSDTVYFLNERKTALETAKMAKNDDKTTKTAQNAVSPAGSPT